MLRVRVRACVCGYLNMALRLTGRHSAPMLVNIVEVFHLLLSFILQACSLWDLSTIDQSDQGSYVRTVQMKCYEMLRFVSRKISEGGKSVNSARVRSKRRNLDPSLVQGLLFVPAWFHTLI